MSKLTTLATWPTAVSSWTAASWIGAALCAPIILSAIRFFMETGTSSITLWFAWLILLRRWNVFDVILGEVIEIRWTEFYEYTHIFLDVAAHLLLWVLN